MGMSDSLSIGFYLDQLCGLKYWLFTRAILKVEKVREKVQEYLFECATLRFLMFVSYRSDDV